MAEITYTPIVEPTVLSATSLNGPFSTIRDGINDLPEDALAPGALNENHLPSLVVAQNSVRVGSIVNQHTYTSGTFTVITRAGNDLEIDFGSDIALGTGNGVGGILVFMEVFMAKIRTTGTDEGFPTGKGFSRIGAAPTAGGAYSGITRTMRYVAGEYDTFAADPDFSGTAQRLIMSTQTLITAADMATVRKIRGAVRVDPAAPAANDQTMTLRECWLSAIVLRSSEV